MKNVLILILITTCFNARANGLLLLRARVPASTKVLIEWVGKRPVSKVINNSRYNAGLTKVEMKKQSGGTHYLVSITHP